MSDTNFSYMEVSAKRKKRNQFISVLIIVAIILLGVIVWGWLELQKSRNAERIKNALNSQVEPGFKEPNDEALEPFKDTADVIVQDTPATTIAKSPEPIPAEPAKIESSPIELEKPVKVEKPEPKPVKPKAEISKIVPPSKEMAKAQEPVIKSEPVIKKEPEPVITKEPVATEPPKPIVEPAKTPVKTAPIVAKTPEPKPLPIPVAPAIPVPTEPKVQATPPAPPAKAFPPEDLPAPSKAEPSEEARLAMAFIPPVSVPEKTTGENTDATPGSSNHFKSGLTAYRQQDYVNAIRSFTAISQPVSKKRGEIDREEYVQANFLKGVSLLKVGHMSEAVTAFQNVLSYEKYYPLANMNLGICYVEMKQYAKAHQAFEAVIRDQSFIESAVFDDVMQRTKYFWALAWTRLYKNATNPDKQNYYRQQAVLKWKDYDVWFSKNEKYKNENQKAENYLKSLSSR
jgi:hypothetical protein